MKDMMTNACEKEMVLNTNSKYAMSLYVVKQFIPYIKGLFLVVIRCFSNSNNLQILSRSYVNEKVTMRHLIFFFFSC